MIVKIDLTTSENPEYQKLVLDYDVKGVPTVVFLDGNGRERLELRLVEFMQPRDFLVHMKEGLML